MRNFIFLFFAFVLFSDSAKCMKFIKYKTINMTGAVVSPQDKISLKIIQVLVYYYYDYYYYYYYFKNKF